MNLRRLAASLFVITAALFAIGVASEGEESAAESAAEQAEGSETVDAGEVAESEAGEEAEGGSEEVGHEESEAGEEKVLGVDIESPTTVALAVIASLALAAGLWSTRRRWVALLAVAMGVLFAVFDVAEVFRQLDESRAGIAALAAVVAIGHAVAAGAAGASLRQR